MLIRGCLRHGSWWQRDVLARFELVDNIFTAVGLKPVHHESNLQFRAIVAGDEVDVAPVTNAFR